jgi:hypothetical protein
MQDVVDGVVSTRAAEEVYGVILSQGAVDANATLQRRSELRRVRMAGGKTA